MAAKWIGKSVRSLFSLPYVGDCPTQFPSSYSFFFFSFLFPLSLYREWASQPFPRTKAETEFVLFGPSVGRCSHRGEKKEDHDIVYELKEPFSVSSISSISYVSFC